MVFFNLFNLRGCVRYEEYLTLIITYRLKDNKGDLLKTADDLNMRLPLLTRLITQLGLQPVVKKHTRSRKATTPC